MATPNVTIGTNLAQTEPAKIRVFGSSWRTTGTIVCADAFSLTTAAATSMALWAALNHKLTAEIIAALPLIVAVFLLCFAVSGLYPGVAVNPTLELRDLIVLITLMYAVMGTAVFLIHGTELYSRAVFLIAWLQTLFWVPLWRTLVRRRVARTSWWGYPTVVFGTGDAGERLARSLLHNPELGLRPIAVLQDGAVPEHEVLGIPILPGFGHLSQLVRESGVRHGIVAMPGITRVELLAVLSQYGEMLPHLYIIPDLFGISSLWVQATDVAGLLAFRLHHRLLLPSARLVKRVLDLAVILLACIPLVPLFVLCGLAIKLSSPGPVFYGHARLGRGGKYFKAWKFRSMVVNSDEVLKHLLETDAASRDEWERTQKLKNDPRITWIGRLLRVTSLDELPQLLNVLRDEMSLVGPRPIVENEIARYGKAIELYQKVAPGITGLWQVSGRNKTTYPERVAWDEYYVRNWSAWLDLHILIRTVDVVLRREGAM